MATTRIDATTRVDVGIDPYEMPKKDEKMKKIKFAKIISCIVFIIFYLFSFNTSSGPSEGDRNITILYYIFLTLTIITVLVITALYAKSKKFLITISAYFLLWYVVTEIFWQIDYDIPDAIMDVFIIIHYSFLAPFMGIHIYVDKLSKFFNDTDYAYRIIFILVVISVYAVYFISRKLQMNKFKRDINEKLPNSAYEYFEKAVLSWAKECPEEVLGIADGELNSQNLKLISINITESNKQGFIYNIEAKYSKTFSNGEKVIYILKFHDDFDIFDDVFYIENKGE